MDKGPTYKRWREIAPIMGDRKPTVKITEHK
jgi:hypothetical protein